MLPLVDEVVLEVGALVDPVAVVKLRPEQVIGSELGSREDICRGIIKYLKMRLTDRRTEDF